MSTERRTLDKTFGFIKAYYAKRGYPPSVTEVAVELGTSRATAHRMMHLLAEHGLITMEPGVARTAVPTGAVMKAPEVTL